MKLNDKGLQKVLKMGLEINDYNRTNHSLEPGDFEDFTDWANYNKGYVVLSVAEAELALSCVQTAWLMSMLHRRPEEKADKDLADTLSKRIKEASK